MKAIVTGIHSSHNFEYFEINIKCLNCNLIINTNALIKIKSDSQDIKYFRTSIFYYSDNNHHQLISKIRKLTCSEYLIGSVIL